MTAFTEFFWDPFPKFPSLVDKWVLSDSLGLSLFSTLPRKLRFYLHFASYFLQVFRQWGPTGRKSEKIRTGCTSQPLMTTDPPTETKATPFLSFRYLCLPLCPLSPHNRSHNLYVPSLRLRASLRALLGLSLSTMMSTAWFHTMLRPGHVTTQMEKWKTHPQSGGISKFGLS